MYETLSHYKSGGGPPGAASVSGTPILWHNNASFASLPPNPAAVAGMPRASSGVMPSMPPQHQMPMPPDMRHSVGAAQPPPLPPKPRVLPPTGSASGRRERQQQEQQRGGGPSSSAYNVSFV